ncbi:MAG: peptide ABC transporter substrate-binding protein [Treponemataceae bacterium]
MCKKKIFSSLLFILVVCAFSFSSIARERDFVIIDSPHEYNLNPHTASYSSEAQILTSIYEGLFSYDPFSLEPRPALAESFRISRDQLTWTFSLRKDAAFSNGDKITANDVYNSWKKLLSPTLNAPFSSLLDMVVGAKDYRTGKLKDFSSVGITVRSEYSLVVKLLSPTEHFAKILCHHAFSVLKENLNIYSGAFAMETNNSKKMYLKKNPSYWDAASVAVKGVQIIFSDDFDNNALMFNAGEVDWVLGNANTSQILNKKAISLSPQFGTEYLFFKTDALPVDDLNLRKALVHAVPWEEVRKDSIIKATTLVLPLQGYPAALGFEEEDMELAEEYLRASSYDQKTAETIIFAVPDEKVSIERASIFVTAWKKIGVNVELQIIPISNYLAHIATSKAHIFSYIWIGDFADPLAFLELFRGDSTLNESKWKNAEFDTLLDEAAKITDMRLRYEKLSEAEQVLIDSSVIMPLSHTVSLNIVDFDNISGWYDNVLDIHLFKYIKFNEPLPISDLVFESKF